MTTAMTWWAALATIGALPLHEAKLEFPRQRAIRALRPSGCMLS